MAHFLPPEHVRQVNKLEWPDILMKVTLNQGKQNILTLPMLRLLSSKAQLLA